MINVINLIIRIEIYTYIIEKAQRRKILLMKKCFIIGYGIVERKFFDDVVKKVSRDRRLYCILLS